MGTIKRFEDIDVWQKARKLADRIYRLTGTNPFKKDFGLRDQIQRAGVSIMANIAEGFASGGNKMFVRYLLYSRASLAEVQNHLYIALDREYLPEPAFNDMYAQTTCIGKSLNGFIGYLKSKKN